MFRCYLNLTNVKRRIIILFQVSGSSTTGYDVYAEYGSLFGKNFTAHVGYGPNINSPMFRYVSAAAHGDVMVSKQFPLYWSFVRKIQKWVVGFPQEAPVIITLLSTFVVSPKPVNMQSSGRGNEMS